MQLSVILEFIYYKYYQIRIILVKDLLCCPAL
jgi:hypothetical protein